MKRNIYHYNNLLRIYNKYRRKLVNLRLANKNVRRQHILQKNIAKLHEKLTVLNTTLRLSTAAASVVVGSFAFVQSANAQVGFVDKQVNPFNIVGLGGNYNSTPTFADIDGDGDLDMLTGDYYYDYYTYTYTGENRFKYYENIGTAANPIFAAPVINPFGITGNNNYSEYFSPTFVDIDGDGDMDIVYGDFNGNINYLENIGSPTAPAFAAPVSNPFNIAPITGGYYSGRSNPSFVDIDGDGDLDLITGDLTGDFYYFENIGSASAPSFAALTTNPFNLSSVGYFGNSAPSFIDIDGDGDFDLISGHYDGNFYYYENIGSSIAADFAASQMNPFNLTFAGNYSYSGPSRPTFADLDNDGDLDLISGDGDGDFTYFRQCAASTSTLNVSTACSYTAPDGMFYNSSGTFTSIIENADGCDSIITINLTINSLFDQSLIASNPVLCGSGATTIDLGSSQDGVSYYLRDDADNSVIAGPIVGDGSGISFNTGTISSDITYNVYAENTLTRSLGIEMQGDIDNRITIPGVNLNGNSFSIEFWAKRSSTNSQDHIISQGSNNTNQGLHIGFRGNNRFTFAFFGNDLDTDNSYTDNNWHHFAVTYDVGSGERIIYVDGAFEKSDVTASTYNGTGNVLLGDTPWGSDEFAGRMDEVRIWNGVRTVTEIQDNMSECLTGSESGLVAYYQFEDGPGSTVLTDATVNGYDGTLSSNIDENVAWQEGVSNCSSTCTLTMTQTATVSIVPELVGTNNTTICNNESIEINGTTYDASNSTGTEVYSNVGVNGCDSTVMVNLNVLPALNTMTSVVNETITATLSGVTYQWVDCDNGNAPISGATGQSFTATSNGNYAVEITDNGCTEISSCVTISSASIANVDVNALLSVYPNPTNGLVQVTLPETLFGQTIILTNTMGQVLETKIINSTMLDYNLQNLSNGIYFIQVQTENGLISKKIVKK